MRYGAVVEHNGKEIKGPKKLLYMTLEDIVEAYILYPFWDAVKAIDKLLSKH